MKYLLYIIGFSILAISCGPKSEGSPTDLAGFKAAIKENKAKIADLQTLNDDYQNQVNQLEGKTETQILVRVDSVSKGDFNRYTKLQASVMSDNVANVSSETGGRIISMTAKEGQRVSRGQLIGSVDLESVEKQMSEVQSSLDLAKTIYDRQKRLWDQEIGSEIQYLQAKNNVERLEKSIETIQTNLKKKNFYAPISGVVDREFAKAGELASPGMPIVSILSTNDLKVVADVPEIYLSKVKRGDEVALYFPALDLKMNRKIKLLGSSIDPANRTFKIEVDIPNKGGAIKPNLLAEVEINDLSIKDAVSIPVDIIQEEINGKKYVFVAVKKGSEVRAKKVVVETGDSFDGKIIITKGLSGDEQVVTDGARALTDNILLKLS